MKNLLKIGCAIISLAVSAALLSASAADYNWTGGAGNGLFSDSGNWTNATGEAVAPADNTSTTFSFWFPLNDAGLVVTQDVNGTVIAKSFDIERSGNAEAELKIVSKPRSGSDKYVFDFSQNSTITVPANTTLYLNTDVGRWVNSAFSKNGAGRIVFDLIYSPDTERPFVLNAGTAEVAATSANTRYLVRFGGNDIANPPVFINHKDGEVLGGLDMLRPAGNAELNGTTVKVGSEALITGSTNILPAVTDNGGTIVFRNERVGKLSERVSSFNIALDRADVVVPDFGGTVIEWRFNDSSDPKKDDVGFGSRLLASSTSNLSVINDATRGNVLSFTGSAYFKGPDADNWLNEFDPSKGFTLAFWLKPAENCNNAAKIFFFGRNESNKALAIRLNTTAGKNLMITTWDGNQELPVTNLRDGNWHHIAVTFTGLSTGNNVLMYYDGVMTNSISRSSYSPEKKDLYIGTMAGTAWGSAGGGNPYTGLMDDFILVSRSYSAREIYSLYTSGPSSESNPVLGEFASESSGALLVEAPEVSLKTLSGKALVGGVEMQKDGSTLTVGADAGNTTTEFRGKVSGENSTFVKNGADYGLDLSGAMDGVTNVVVNGGALTLRRPGRTRRGLVACYSFEDADLGRDSSVLGTHLVDTNLPSLSAVAGVSGKAIHFPDTHASLQSQEVVPSVFPSGNGSYTISVWIKPTAAAVSGTVPICCWGNNNVKQLSLLRFNGEGKLMFSNWNADLEVSGFSDLTDGNWHHVVVTYDGGTNKKVVYYDGAQRSEATVEDGLNITHRFPIQLGHCSVDSRVNQYYTGDMDEFMVFNYAWTRDEVAAEYNHTATPTVADVSGFLPAPVARWTFDGDDPLEAEGGEDSLKLSKANGDVTFESGDAICGKAARFTTENGFLRLDTFPSDIIPTGSANFTIIARYRPDTDQISNLYPAIVGWGDDGGWSLGKMVRLGVGGGQSYSVRAALRSIVLEVEGTQRTTLGTDRSRWYTVALVCRTIGSTYNSWVIVDGEIRGTGGSTWNTMAITAQDFVIGSNFDGTKSFKGLVDDVQIYDKALSAGEVRLIAEQLDASKGQATTGTAVPTSVLTAQPDVTVAQGAKLKVASVETIGSLSGAGAVEIAPLARLNVSGVNGFSGAVTGAGTLAIADNAVLEFGDGASPLLNVAGSLTLGEHVTVNSTARRGRLILAHASEFVDVENLATWTAVLPGNRQYKFEIADSTDGGKDLRLVIPSGLLLLIR